MYHPWTTLKNQVLVCGQSDAFFKRATKKDFMLFVVTERNAHTEHYRFFFFSVAACHPDLAAVSNTWK